MLLRHEMKKTFFAPVMIGFALLCVVFNIVIVLSNDTTSYAEEDAEPYNVFEGYSTSALADSYVSMYQMTGGAEKNIREKYDALQPVVDEKAANGDALSPYFGYGTPEMHRLLFGDLLFAVIAEGCLIAMFAALILTGYENTHGTELIVCASKTGRRILRTKLAAALITGLAAFALILAVSLAVFFARYDFSAVWDDNVSSSFNHALGVWFKPFITWRSFTVGRLLLAEIAVAAGLTVVFCLFGFAAGTFFRSGYVACGAAAALCLLQFLLPLLFQMGGTLRGALNLTPVMLWFSSGGGLHTGGWFTDGGEGIICAHYESVGLFASFVVLAAVCLVAMACHKRRDLL